MLLPGSMLVRTPAIRPNAAAEIHLFTASVADRMKLGKGKSDIFSITVHMIESIYPPLNDYRRDDRLLIYKSRN